MAKKKRAKKVLKPGSKDGRPRIEFDWEEFDKLCMIHATEEEIAAWFRCSVDTVDRACKEKHGTTFAEYKAQKAGIGKVSLRRAQIQKALKGDNCMLIWCGKQYLGQKEPIRVDAQANVSGHLTHELATPTFVGLNEAQLTAAIEQVNRLLLPTNETLEDPVEVKSTP